MEVVSRFVQFWQMYQFKIVAGVTGIKNIYISARTLKSYKVVARNRVAVSGLKFCSRQSGS